MIIKKFNETTKNKVPTAEEFLNNYKFPSASNMGNKDFEIIEQFAIDFTKLHVQAALESATENIVINYDNDHLEINKNSILGAYPENLIK